MELRARRGSERLAVESLEPRIAEMEEAKAVGSFRFEFFLETLVRFGLLGWEAVELEASESESEPEADGDVPLA